MTATTHARRVGHRANKTRGSRDPLRIIPGIGPSLARDLRRLGYRSPSDLRSADPEEMYDRLCRLTACRQDPCVLYVFRCAVYYATRTRRDPELLKWWNWRNRRLRPLR